MSLRSKKQKVFGEIAAARTLVDGMPKLRLTSSFPSINNSNDPILFLTDLIKALIGQSELIKTVTDFLTKALDDIEKKLKIVLKRSLRGIVTCGVDPSIPAFLKSTGSGILIEIKKIDFFDQLKTDPNTTLGSLMYNDVTPTLTNSTDFNTFLYGVIQDETITHTWNNILDFTFYSLGTGGNPNNSLIIKANPSYDNKTLNDLNDNFIDSLDLFDSKDIINKLIDLLFGSISVRLNKTRKQLETEAQINDIVDRLSNADINDEITDNYFTFSNDEIAEQESQANDRRNGIIRVKTSVETNADMPITYLEDFTSQIVNVSTTIQRKQIINDTLTNISNNLSNQIPNDQDKQTVRISFISELIRNMTKAIASMMLSPKIIIIFLINFKIIFGLTSSFDGPIDFIKKNRALFTDMFKEINNVIIKLLVTIAMKNLTKLAGDAAIVKLKEKTDNKKQQLLSLVGVPQDAIRLIKNLL